MTADGTAKVESHPPKLCTACGMRAEFMSLRTGKLYCRLHMRLVVFSNPNPPRDKSNASGK